MIRLMGWIAPLVMVTLAGYQLHQQPTQETSLHFEASESCVSFFSEKSSESNSEIEPLRGLPGTALFLSLFLAVGSINIPDLKSASQYNDHNLHARAPPF